MRNISIAALVSALLSAIFATPVDSQVVHTGRKTTATGSVPAGTSISTHTTNIAVIAPPPVVAYPNSPVFIPPGMSLLVNVPVFVLPDGRVFANFGRGFEQIARNCAAAFSLARSTAPAVQPVVSQPVVVQPIPGLPTAQPFPLPYTPQVPNPTATSQQVEAQIMAARQSSLVNATACWTSTSNGQIFIARP